MNKNDFNNLKEKDVIKLNFVSSRELKGRFNKYDEYTVELTRAGRMIHDDSGAIRFLHDIYKHFHRADKWN